MLRKVFNSETSWYNRVTDRLECNDEQYMFFGVTAKTFDNLNYELELGEKEQSCKTEEIDSLIALTHNGYSPRSQQY
jgi:hypothetical protein